MNPLKLRRLLVSIHLYLAGFMAPAFLLVAVSGALHFAAGGGEQKARAEISLPADATLNLNSPTREADLRALLKASNIDADFEYIMGRGNKIHTRPTSRPSLEIEQTADGLKMTRVTPNLQASLMELHKGHGPRIFRLYQLVVGIVLIFVVLGGVLVGLLAKNYRKPTLIAGAVGSVVFLVTGFIM